MRPTGQKEPWTFRRFCGVIGLLVFAFTSIVAIIQAFLALFFDIIPPSNIVASAALFAFGMFILKRGAELADEHKKRYHLDD